MNKLNSQCILVLGMHRSGTSALTGVLSHLGVDTGPCLMPAHETVNPRGFWEHAEIVSIHDELLEFMDSSWDDVRTFPSDWWKNPGIATFRKALVQVIHRDFSHSPVWAVKDPRMCRLLPLWLDILAEIGVRPLIILNLRDPYSVAQSLEKRDGFSNVKAHLLWMQYFLDAEFWSQGYPKIVVTYQQLLNDWITVAHSISELFSVPLNTENPDAIEQVKNFLEPSLRHYDTKEQVIPEDELSQLANEAYRLATTAQSSILSNSLSHVRMRINLIASLVAPWAASMKETESQVVHLAQENSHLKDEVARVKATVSWRLTKPLRLIANLPALIKRFCGFS